MKSKGEFSQGRWSAGDTAFAYWARNIRSPKVKLNIISAVLDRSKSSITQRNTFFNTWIRTGLSEGVESKTVEQAGQIIALIRTGKNNELVANWEAKIANRSPGELVVRTVEPMHASESDELNAQEIWDSIPEPEKVVEEVVNQEEKHIDSREDVKYKPLISFEINTESLIAVIKAWRGQA